MRGKILLVASGVSILASCGGESSAPDRPASGGVIRGRVTSAAGVPAMRVTATEDVPPGDDRARNKLSTDTGDAGTYTILVPPGAYRVGVKHLMSDGTCDDLTIYRGPRGLVADVESARVVQVGPLEVVEAIDFAFGSARVRIPFESGWEGSQWHVSWENPRLFLGACSMDPRAVESDFLELEIATLVPGQYTLGLDHRGSGLLITPLPPEAGPDLMEVVAEHETLYECAPIPPPAYFEGHVRGPAGPRHFVELRTLSGARLSYGFADSLGSTSVLVPSRVPFHAVIEFGGIERWIGGADASTAELFVLEPGERRQAFDLDPSRIEVTLTGESGHLSHSMILTLFDADGGPLGGEQIYSFADTARWEGLPPGAYSVYVCAALHLNEPWLPQWYDRAPDRAGATPLIIREDGDLVQVQVHLEAGGWIHGRVLGPDGLAPPDAVVFLTSAERDTLIGSDDELQDPFVLQGLFDGRYKVGAASSRSAEVTWWPGTSAWDSAGVITIADHQAVRGIEIRVGSRNRR